MRKKREMRRTGNKWRIRRMRRGEMGRTMRSGWNGRIRRMGMSEKTRMIRIKRARWERWMRNS